MNNNEKYDDDAAIRRLQKTTRTSGQIANNQYSNNVNGNQKINSQNHQRPSLGVQPKENSAINAEDTLKSDVNSTNKSDIGVHNLKNSIANKSRNIFNNRKRKKSTTTSSESGASDANDDTQKSDSNNILDDISAKLKVRLKIKIIIFGSIILLFLLVVFSFFMAVFGIDIAQTIPSVSPNTYGTSSFTSTFDEGTEEYKNEIKYYEKLKEVSKNYAASHGEELRINYIHSILIYVYYQVDIWEISETGDSIPINYSKMTGMVDKIVALMTPSSNKIIDYEKNGEFYNNLKNSSVIKDYYRELLKEKDIDTVLGEVFDIAEGLDDISLKDDTVITDETEVTVNNNQSMTINSYLTDSIYASTTSIQNSEMVKAYTIAYSTNLASQNNKLTIDSNSAAASNNLCSVKDGCSYNDNNQLVSGPGKKSSKNTVNYNGKYYYRRPLTQDEINNLNKNINSVFGNVLVKDDGTYPVLDIDKINGLGDGYQAILSNSYGSLSYKSIGEDSYILDGSYGTKQVKTQVTFYDQGDYTSYNFCGKKKETIKTSGCGITSMAMIVSTYEKNSKYDPVAMMNEARKTGYCGGSIVGTSPGFFKKEASTMKYKYYKASKSNKKDLNTVLKHLSEGHLVIAHMSPGHFTNGGHYMVLGGVDPGTKKVYVYDPNNKSNSSWRKTGNGWYSFNDIIVKEAWNFYIIWKG